MKPIIRFVEDFARHCGIYCDALGKLDDSVLSNMVEFYSGKHDKAFLLQQSAIEWTEYSLARELIKGRLIFFSSSLAEHILATADNYTGSVDYMVPFPAMVIYFDKPLSIQLGDEGEKIEALLFFQKETTTEDLENFKKDALTVNDKKLMSLGLNRPDVVLGEMNNAVVAVFSGERRAIRKISWQGGIEEKLYQIDYERTEKTVADGWNAIRQLAVACVGYINCENVYLYTEPDTSITSNGHRKGKTQKRPYYTCRIRGVNYDNSVVAGKGTSPGHIFDVRGHFRRLGDGKVTWVRPHLRGLKSGGEYVPKVYDVNK